MPIVAVIRRVQFVESLFFFGGFAGGLRGYSYRDRFCRDHASWGHYRAGGYYSPPFDDSAVQDQRAYADQGIVVHSASVKHRSMPDDDPISYGQRESASSHVEHAKILDIGLTPDSY